MGLLDVFKKKEVRLPEPYIPRETLPEDLERFRTPAREIPTPEYPAYPETPALPSMRIEPTATVDKLDLILQKLETIDARLKLLEERMK